MKGQSRGLFIFDISSAQKLRSVVANNTFAEDREDITYIWFNSLEGDRVTMDLTLFERRGDLFKRFDERHVQYIYGEEEILSALKEAGFAVGTEGHLGADKSDRINL